MRGPAPAFNPQIFNFPWTRVRPCCSRRGVSSRAPMFAPVPCVSSRLSLLLQAQGCTPCNPRSVWEGRLPSPSSGPACLPAAVGLGEELPNCEKSPGAGFAGQRVRGTRPWRQTSEWGCRDPWGLRWEPERNFYPSQSYACPRLCPPSDLVGNSSRELRPAQRRLQEAVAACRRPGPHSAPSRRAAPLQSGDH